MQWLAARRVMAGTAMLALGGLVAAAAPARPGERPASEVTDYAADLRRAATLAEQAASSAAWVGSRSAKGCPQFSPAASKLAAAADAARAVFQRYHLAKTRYGTQEEIRLMAMIAVSLREARANLAKAAGESGTPSAAEEKHAEREVGLFQTFVALKLEDRLRVEGLAGVLTQTSFRDMRARIVSQLQRRLRERAEAELQRLTGLRLRLDVPLKQQIRDFLQAELSRLLSRLVVSAGPAGIIVSVLGQRIFGLIGQKLKVALRNKGDLERRTATTLTGFERLRRGLNALPPDAPLDRVRGVVRDVQRALGEISFLKGDAERARRKDLLDKLATGERELRRTLSLSKHRFLLDSDLVGESFGVAIAYSAKTRAEAERLAKKLGCAITAPMPPGPPPPSDGQGKPPTPAVCVPSTIRMEYFGSLGGKLGEYDVRFHALVNTGELGAKCLWVGSGPTDEAFVAFISYVPIGTPGSVPSGDCSRTKPDNPPFFHSRKRQLTVSGGNRKSFQNAVGGNDKILKGVLAAAEAAGVGKPCP